MPLSIFEFSLVVRAVAEGHFAPAAPFIICILSHILRLLYLFDPIPALLPPAIVSVIMLRIIAVSLVTRVIPITMKSAILVLTAIRKLFALELANTRLSPMPERPFIAEISRWVPELSVPVEITL